MLLQTSTPRTPLQTAMDALASRLSMLSFGVIGLIVLVGVIQSRGLLEMFTVGGASRVFKCFGNNLMTFFSFIGRSSHSRRTSDSYDSNIGVGSPPYVT